MLLLCMLPISIFFDGVATTSLKMHFSAISRDLAFISLKANFRLWE